MTIEDGMDDWTGWLLNSRLVLKARYVGAEDPLHDALKLRLMR